MPTENQLPSLTNSFMTNDPVSFLAQELAEWQAAYEVQPVLVQRFLDTQAHRLAEALLQHASQVRFMLPDRVVLKTLKTEPIAPEQREQLAGGLFDRFTRTDLNTVLRQRLAELETSTTPAIAASAGLLRYATAANMVHNLLPSGRSVQYRALEGEEIPTLPEENELEPGSAITAVSDAIVEESENGMESDRGALLTPYVPAARRFYLPQWVAFDDQDRLLVNTLSEAEAQVASMQRFLTILHAAVAA